MKWQEIITSSTTKTIKKNNNDDNTDIYSNIDMDKIVRSRNWSNLHTEGHRSLVFKNRYFLLSGGFLWAKDRISVFDI